MEIPKDHGPLRSVKVTVEYEYADGHTDSSTWDMSPDGLHMAEERPVRPLYHPGEMNPYTFEPLRGQHTLQIHGHVREK